MTSPSILYVITQTEMGGAQRALFTLAKNAPPGWQVMVAAGMDGDGGLERACASAHIRFVSLPHLRRAIRPSDDWRALGDIRQLVAREQPTVVHAHSSKAGILASLALCRTPRPPWLVYTAHGWPFLERVGNLTRFLYRMAERLAAGRRDATIVLSNMERDVARRMHLATPDALFVIPNGIAPAAHDRTQARAVLHALGVPNEALVVGSVAHFYPNKNIPELVRSFAAVLARHPQAHLVLIGDGQERAAVETAAAAIASRVHLLGSRNDARALLAGFDLFALPSTKEGLPFSLLEAMEAGLPCLATTIGGMPQVIADPMNGFLCAPDRLTDGLDRALAASARWPDIGRAAQETVRTLFTEERMVRETAALYCRLAARAA